MDYRKKLYVKPPFGITGLINAVGGSKRGIFAEVYRDRSKPIEGSAHEPQEDAARLVLCWNEHDTLKVKAELWDEIVDWFEADDNKEYVKNETTRELVNLVVNLLSKAKNL